MTIKQILTKLGYQEAGVEYDENIIYEIEKYFLDNKINSTNLSYKDSDYKKVGTLYKYFYLVNHPDTEFDENTKIDINDDGHYSNWFWKV